MGLEMVDKDMNGDCGKSGRNKLLEKLILILK